MNKRDKKKIQTLNQRIQKLRLQVAGAKKQLDDPAELALLERELETNEAELAKLKAE
jgi:hypothetical protein